MIKWAGVTQTSRRILRSKQNLNFLLLGLFLDVLLDLNKKQAWKRVSKDVTARVSQ